MTDTATAPEPTAEGRPLARFGFHSVIEDHPECASPGNPETRRPCACGCGALPVKPTSRFIRGHNTADALRTRIHSVLMSEPAPSGEHPGAVLVPLRGPLAAGRMALVDEADYELVALHNWTVNKRAEPGRRVRVYAQTNVRLRTGSRRTMGMHALITGYALPDHINHNTLDNRRSNLRPATGQTNSRNSLRRINGSSVYKGVSWYRRYGKWLAVITYGGRQHNLGYYADQIGAALAYDAAAREHFGEFACLNFPADPAEMGATA